MGTTPPAVFTQRAQQLQDQGWQQKADAQKQAIAPLAQASQAAQTRLALLADPNDPTKPVAGKETEYSAAHDQLADIIGKMRVILHPPPPDDPHGLKYLAARAADKLHITNDLAARMQVNQADKARTASEQGRQQDYQAATTAAQGIPYNPLSADEQAEAARIKAGIETKPVDLKPELKNFRGPNGQIALYDANKPESIPQGWTIAPTGAAQPAVKPLEAGGVPYGVEANGNTYLASDMDKSTTPPEVRSTWNTIQGAIKDKKDAADRKEKEAQDRFIKSQEDIAGRMGRSELFQAQMADFREKEQVYKTLDTQAWNDQSKVDTYKAQYEGGGNHAATDTALITDFTSILAKGGRKTQAEIALAQKIGDYKLNAEQKWKKLTTGELPEELRQMYLDYMDHAAQTSRTEADKAKPALPELVMPKTPKAESLKKTQQSGKSLADRLNDALGQ